MDDLPEVNQATAQLRAMLFDAEAWADGAG